MIKLKFKKNCMDKYTHAYYEADSIHEFDTGRAIEILDTGYAEAIAEAVVEKEKCPIELTKLTKAQLVEMAKECRVSTSGTKAEIIQRLLDVRAFQE